MSKDEILKDIQAGILKPNGREFNYFYVFKFKDTNKSIFDWIKKLKVTTAKEQEDYTKLRKDTNEEKVVINFFLSNFGYRHIYDTKKPSMLPLMEHLSYNFFSNSLLISNFHRNISEDKDIPYFRKGMGADSHENQFLDPPKEDWEYPYNEEMHALLILSSDEIALIETEWKRIYNASIIDNFKVEKGTRLERNGELIGHFGYKDGISKIPFYKPNGEFDMEQLRLYTTEENGSFVVFRKLHQDVEKFNKGVGYVAAQLKNNGAEHDNIMEFVEGQIMGRFKDGTPILLHDSTGVTESQKEEIEQFDNTFYSVEGLKSTSEKSPIDYSSDPQGLKCPFHAHIRRVNPRDKEVIGKNGEIPSTILRRGIPYDEAVDKKGLLFICFQRSIKNQFAIIQTRWANGLEYENSGERGPKKIKNVDIIGGQSENDKTKQWITKWGEKTEKIDDFHLQDVVNFLGGEFFYAPPKKWIDNPESKPSLLEYIILTEYRDRYIPEIAFL